MITALRFFQDREQLAGPDGYQLGARSKDRTVSVVRKWLALSSTLPLARQATLGHCEAVEGKGGIVSLRVADRAGFEALQAQIKAQSEEMARIEHVIKSLDDLGPDIWFTDLEDQVGSYGRVETGENQRLANLASATLARKVHSGLPADQILAQDDEYQRISRIAKEQISNANKQLSALRPKLESVRALLESVGC